MLAHLMELRSVYPQSHSLAELLSLYLFNVLTRILHCGSEVAHRQWQSVYKQHLFLILSHS
jgi:hypothetical protein